MTTKWIPNDSAFRSTRGFQRSVREAICNQLDSDRTDAFCSGIIDEVVNIFDFLCEAQQTAVKLKHLRPTAIPVQLQGVPSLCTASSCRNLQRSILAKAGEAGASIPIGISSDLFRISSLEIIEVLHLASRRLLAGVAGAQPNTTVRFQPCFNTSISFPV